MSSKIILKAEDLDGYLTEQDNLYLQEMDNLYAKAMDSFKIISSGGFSSTLANEEKKVIEVFNEMGHLMQKICHEVPGLHVFSFDTEEERREVVRLAGYEYDEEQKIFYTHLNPWQRYFGFHDIYDRAAPITAMVYLTLKVDFTYGNYDWRLQWWKGQYGVLEGAELGVYTKDKGTPGDFYEWNSLITRLLRIITATTLFSSDMSRNTGGLQDSSLVLHIHREA